MTLAKSQCSGNSGQGSDHSDQARFLHTYYEYNPFTEKKIVIGARNAGARVQCELDQQRSMLTTIPAEGETAQKISVADYLAMDEDARNAIQIKYITMVAKVVALYSIG